MSRPVWVQLGNKLSKVSWTAYEERDEDGGIHQNQAQDGSPTVANTVGNRSSKENTNKCTALTGLEESTLPFRGDGVLGFSRNGYAVTVLKSRKRDKVSVEKHVKRFHNLTGISYASFRQAGLKPAHPGCSRARRNPHGATTYNGEAHNERPHATQGISLDGSPHAHLMFTVLALEGIDHEIRVDQDLGLLDVVLPELLYVHLFIKTKPILVFSHAGRHFGSLLAGYLDQFEGEQQQTEEGGESQSLTAVMCARWMSTCRSRCDARLCAVPPCWVASERGPTCVSTRINHVPGMNSLGFDI